jgi:serine/threonine protein kinase/Tfp pilus assembly protein PilF
MLSAAQMAQMSRLLDEALELDPAGRRSWLEALSADYQDLEPALRRALLPDGDGASSSEQSVTLPNVGAGVQTNEIGSGLQAGERVGPYLLVRPLGAGGMAEVWLAQRADGAFKREVALKLPMLSRLRKDLASRFARERDILAALEHPNIARLYDAGVSSEGLPYLAMEYVHGEALTAWCNAHRLGIRERLKLFLQVLDAVQYAHGHQVIHRDIKPSNILVTESGQVRLLDFGVAKLLANEEEQTELTQIYGRALTPEYASPELVRGDPIDAAADVYSLGVVLYELLSGSRPYRLKTGASMLQLEQAIATAQVERPSTQLGRDAGTDRSTTQDKLARRLRGDLDAIVLKALAKAPADRYGSASALADDLQRYLGGDPVEARPPNPAYLIGKFVQRHRTGVASTAAIAVLVAAGIGYEVMRSPGTERWPAGGTNTATAITANTSFSDKSIAVLPFVDMSERHDQEYFSDGLSEELIDRLSHSPDLKVIARTSAFQFKGKNEDMRSIASKLGVANLLEGSVRKAGNELRVTAQLIRAADGTHLWSQTYDRRLSDVFKVQDDVADKVARALNAVLHQRAAPAAEVVGPSKEAYNLVLVGNYFLNRGSGDWPRAEQAYADAIKLDPNYALAWAKLSVAMPKKTRADLDKALQAVRRSLSIDPNLAYAHYQFGWILMFCEWNWAGAKSELDRAIELDPSNLSALVLLDLLTQGMFGRFDSKIGYIRQIVSNDPLDASALGHLAESLINAGRFDEAIEASEKLVRLASDAACSQRTYGESLLLAGRTREALAAVGRESDEENRLFGLALVYWTAGRKAESDAAAAQLEKKFGADNPDEMVAVHAWRGETDTAFAWMDRSYRRGGGPGSRMPLITVDPLLRSLRGDPRFAAMLTKLKLDEWKKTVSAPA